MAIPSGLSAQLGIAEEVTYGTPVTVTRFYEFVSEKMQLDIKRMESNALRSGTRVQRSDRWVSGEKSIGGEIAMEFGNKSFGLWLKHCMGGVSSVQPNPGPDPTVWMHTFTPGDFPVGLTTQIGRTDIGGTIRSFTYHGCTIDEWTLESSVGEICKFTVKIIGEDEDTSTGLATASYPATLTLLTFVNGTLNLGGSSFDIKTAKITGANSLADDRYFLGSVLRKKPLEAKMREYKGSLEAEFNDLTAYNRFVNGTEAALILVFTGAIISGALPFLLRVTANVRFDGETPNVTGTEIIQQPLAFKCLGNTGASAITLEYQTTDTAP